MLSTWLPITANGKLDTRALPTPDYQDTARYRAPSDAVEEVLVGVYAQILGVLNGSGSMTPSSTSAGIPWLTMRLIAAINTALDADLPALRTVFEAPTVASAPSHISQGARRREYFEGVGRRWNVPPLFRCRSPRTGCGSSTNCKARHRCTTWRSHYGWKGSWTPRRWRVALADVVDRHESLRTMFGAADGIPHQVIVPAERAAAGWSASGWDTVDAGAWPADRLRECRCRRCRPLNTFELANEIPFRTKLFRGSPTTNMCWWPWCTTSPPTAGRSPRW